MNDHHRRHPMRTVYEITASPDDWLVVAVSGEIDMSNASYFEQDLQTASDGSQPVEFDLRGVSFCDSTGLRALLVVAGKVRRSARQLRTRPSPPVAKLLRMTGLEAELGVVG